jgi:hypothetical protein
MVWRGWKRTRNENGEGSTAVNHLHDVGPRLISTCACIYEFSMTEISLVTCVCISVNGIHPMYLSVFFYLIYRAKKCVLKRVYQPTIDGSIFALFKLFLEMVTSYPHVTNVVYVCSVYSIVCPLRLCVWSFRFCPLLNVMSYTTSLSVSDSVCLLFYFGSL